MCAEAHSDDDDTYYSAREATSRDASPLDRWELPPPPHTLPLPMVPTRPPPSAMCVAAPPAAIPPRPEPPSSRSQAIGYAIDIEKTIKIREIIARMPAMRVRLREGGSDTEVDTDAVGISLIEYRLGVPEVARLGFEDKAPRKLLNQTFGFILQVL